MNPKNQIKAFQETYILCVTVHNAADIERPPDIREYQKPSAQDKSKEQQQHFHPPRNAKMKET